MSISFLFLIFVRNNNEKIPFVNLQQYRPSAPELEKIGYTHDQRQRIPNLQKRQKSKEVIMVRHSISSVNYLFKK